MAWQRMTQKCKENFIGGKTPIASVRVLVIWGNANSNRMLCNNNLAFTYKACGALNQLLEGLHGVTPLIKTLPSNACPWAFPVLLEKRSELASLLRKNGVPLFTFGETLHPSQGAAFINDPGLFSSVSKFIKNCLCLPMHQQINRKMIAKYISYVRKIINK